MLIPLVAAVAETCGGKAAGLGRLLRAGLPVPDGVVVPFDADAGQEELRRWLVKAGDPVVAVRSSAVDEDTAARSAAGQYDSFLGVRGVDAVADAVRACRESLWSARATAYRDGAAPGAMAVIVQRQVEANTDPSWTPLLATAAGVVTETGGILSHAAIVARERGIPAVLSVQEATTRIPDGTSVAVDGSAGTVWPSP